MSHPMLRSFKGAHEHATMLPSTAPLEAEESDDPLRLRGGAKRVIGTHTTGRTRDVQAAQAYRKVRTTLLQRNEFWRREVA